MRKILVITLGLFASACSAQDQLAAYPGLTMAINAYYQHEQKGEWDKTYALRTPGFRQNVPTEVYIDSMRRDSKGWILKSFSVLDARPNQGKIEVKMNFIEQAPNGYLSSATKLTGIPDAVEPSVIAMTDTSVWKVVDGKWYCYDAASRAHLSLNNPVIAE